MKACVYIIFTFFLIQYNFANALDKSIDTAINLSEAKNKFSRFFKYEVELAIHDTSFFGHKILLANNKFSDSFVSPPLSLISPHGSAVAQIIGSDNFGVNKNVIFSSFTLGIFLEDFKKAFLKITKNKIKLVNISMGIKNLEIIEILNNYIDQGGIVVLSSGNSAERLGRELPEHYFNFKGITVSASDLDNNLLNFSHYSKNLSVLAPGQIRGTPVNYLKYNQAGSKTEPEVLNKNVSLKNHLFGMTSAAAPLVTGAVSLALQINPDLSQREINEALFNGPKNSEGQAKLDIEHFLSQFVLCSNL